MKPLVTVVDYGMGNLLSVSRAFEFCGAEVLLADSSEKIEGAKRLVLPGVGAFVNGMAELKDRGLIEPLMRFAKSGKPFLGICLGMQMMMDTGEEFGSHKGLGLIPGKVVPIPDTGVDGAPHKIPHIGWNALLMPQNGRVWDGTILEGIAQGVNVYFVHSFHVVPSDDKHRLADCNYNGRIISAVINSGSLYGCQFHPEKSGPAGLKIIKKFLNQA